MKTKSGGAGPRIAVVALCLLACAMAVLVMIGSFPTVAAGAVAGLCALAAIVAAASGNGGLGASDARILDSIDPETSGECLDLGAMAAGADSTGGSPLAEVFGSLNDDIAILQRSAKKFDLFSSDILFSAQNLAEQASGQLKMLATLNESTGRFFETMRATSGELSELSDTVKASEETSKALSERAQITKRDLATISEMTRLAARDAETGVGDADATSAASVELERGLESLNRTARRESEEAGKIAESIKTIADIVERTHVLATNASIEAARAGARGAGFAVIAQEVRKLSSSSRTALEDVDRVLRSVKEGIDQSTALVGSVSASAGRLKGFIEKTHGAFVGIGKGVLDVEAGIERFGSVFAEQIAGATEAAAFAERTAATLKGFSEEYKAQAREYESILKSTKESEAYATDSRRASRLLAQLASYLKAGGAERNRVLRRYRVETESAQMKFGRKERREELLYNLEVFGADGSLFGHLGDLSRSGLQVLSSGDVAVGTRLSLTIALPITHEGEKRLDLRVFVRRSERDAEGYRLGCSIDGAGSSQSRIVDEILHTLSLGSLAAPGAGLPLPEAAATGSNKGGAPLEATDGGDNDAEDAEELEELEEL